MKKTRKIKLTEDILSSLSPTQAAEVLTAPLADDDYADNGFSPANLAEILDDPALTPSPVDADAKPTLKRGFWVTPKI